MPSLWRSTRRTVSSVSHTGTSTSSTNACCSCICSTGTTFQVIAKYAEHNRKEFMTYKMVYMIMGNDKFGLDKMLKELDETDLQSEFTDVVLELKQAILQGNFVRLFRVMREHKMETIRSIMSLFVDKLRLWALTILCRR